MLRGLGVSGITHMRDSSQAAAFLEKNARPAQSGNAAVQPARTAVDIVISDEHLADAPVSVFLYTLARHPVLREHPVLVLTGAAESSRCLRSAGVYLLERPYTLQGLTRMLQKATASPRRSLNAEAFEAVSRQKGLALHPRQRVRALRAVAPATTSDWYAKGMANLQQGDLRGAEYAFIHVLDRQEDHREAALGLARVYHAKGDARGACRYLLHAAAAHLREGDKVRAAYIAAMLPAKLRDNIYFYEALFRMKEGDYKAAALGFLDAARENADDPLHRIISRACLLTSQPEACMRKLCDCLAGMGYQVTAAGLRRRLLVYPEFSPEEPSSWLDSFPRLKEAVNVVSYAAWAWKSA
jgi:tetratricopeptide (TPR) repeat protein